MAIDKERQRSIMTQFQDQALQEGFQIGVYEIQSILRGSRFDLTYRGWNHHLNAPVVLKEYFPQDFAVRRDNDQALAPKSEGDREIYESGLDRFMEIAEVLGQIEHRNIIRVHNTLQINGTAYLIMDNEDGAPLSSKAEALTEPELKNILRSLLAGLEQAHTHAAVHGDIHPSNILLRENGEPVLIDFAAAKLAVCTQHNGSFEDLRAGYAAPEQYEPGSRPNPQSDLYALGATMYRCITRNEPVPAPERILAIRSSKPDPQAELLSSPSAQTGDANLLETIGWMLHLKPQERPQSAAKVLAALSSEDATVQPMDAETTPDDRKHTIEAPRRTALWSAAVIGVVALIAGLWYFQTEKPAPETVAAVKKETRPSPAASKEEAIEMARGDFPTTRTEETTTEIREPIKTEAAAARRQAGDVNQPLSKIESARQQLATTGAEPSPQPPAIAEHAETSTPESLPGPATESDATVVVPAKKADKVALPSSEAIVTNQSNKRSPPKPATGNRPIQSHFAAAEAAIAALRLTTPEENNAYQHYQAVLARDPANVEAQAGIQRIVDLYVWFIEKAIGERRFRRAAIYLARAEMISPNAPSLRRIRAKMAECELTGDRVVSEPGVVCGKG